MKILLVDKEVFPMELLELGPCLIEPKRGHIQVEKLLEVKDEKEQGE